MNINYIVISQYQRIVNDTAKKLNHLELPKEGWIQTVRKALHMSGAQLARRMRVSRANISQTEKAELTGSVTIKSMQNIAEALGCKFIYAIVPDKQIEDIISIQARKKAIYLVKKTSQHMALEDQMLSNDKIKYEIDRLTQDMIKNMPHDLWED